MEINEYLELFGSNGIYVRKNVVLANSENKKLKHQCPEGLFCICYFLATSQRQFSRPEGRVSESPHSQAGTMSTQCSCEGMDEGFLTILQGLTRLEECLVTVAIVTGLQMAFWLGMAIRYVVVRSKKQSKKKTKDEMEEEWKEGVIKMEKCLKTNKKVRKEQREQARMDEGYMKRAQNRKKDARLARETNNS